MCSWTLLPRLLLLFVLATFFSTMGLAQTERLAFETNLNRESTVWVALEEETTYLLFEFEKAYQLMVLDASLQLQDRVILPKPDSLQSMQAVRLLAKAGQLSLYYQPSFKSLNLRCLEVDLETRRLRPLPLDVPYEKSWRLLKSFLHQHSLYLLRVHEDDHRLRLYKVDPETHEIWEFEKPVSDFYPRLKEDGRLYIPLINYDYVLPKHSTADTKLYLSEEALTFSFEDRDSMQTRLFSIDLSDFSTRHRRFALPDSMATPGEKFLMNSLLYEEHAFQVWVPGSRKQLYLLIRQLEDGAVVRSQVFASDEEIVRQFGPIKARKIKERTYKDRYAYKARLLPRMRGAMGLLLERQQDGNLAFSMGTYRKQYVTPLEAAVLGASLAFNLAFVVDILPLQNEEGLSYDPFLGLFSLGYGIFGVATPNHRAYTYAQAVFDPERLLLRSADLPASRTSKLNNFINGQKLYRKGYAQTMFKRGERLFYGYYLKGTYHLVEF